MTYSYGGWQNEFDGLTLENDFSGSAPPDFNTNEEVKDIRPTKRPEPEVFRPTKRPTGLGAKVVVADDTSDDNETKNDESIYGVVKNIMNDTKKLTHKYNHSETSFSVVKNNIKIGFLKGVWKILFFKSTSFSTKNVSRP